MPGLVSAGQFSLGQGCQVRSGWSEQERSRGPGHVRKVLVRTGQSSLVGLVRSGQVCSVRSGQFRLVRSGHVSSGQVKVNQVTLAQVRSGQGRLDRSVQVK